MKPINAEESGCNPISSNCVIWQGPDIECLNLCKGDTVSDVVAKIATELCQILDILDVEAYDLSCFNLDQCDPADFQALLQFLIDKICECCEVDPEQAAAAAEGCPTGCIVDIATCFYFTNPQGDTETTMELTDYVTAIGNRICQLVGSADTTSASLENHENRIVTLESKEDPVYEEVNIVPSFVLPPDPTPVSEVVVELERQYGETSTALGQATELYSAYLKQTPGLNNQPRLAGSGDMSTIQGWEDTIQTLADVLGNTLLQLQDMRSAILNIQANCCPNVCDDINIMLSATLPAPNTLRLFFTGSIPAGFVECSAQGTYVTITDASGGELTTYVNLVLNLNNATGLDIDLTSTPVNSAEDLTITMNPCLTDPDTGTQCQSVVSYFLNNVANCPNLNLIPAETTIDYQFAWTGGAAQFTVELYDQSGTALIASQVDSLAGPGNITGTFAGLTGATVYLIRVKVAVGSTTTECPFVSVTTVAPPCIPPSGVGATLTIP